MSTLLYHIWNYRRANFKSGENVKESREREKLPRPKSGRGYKNGDSEFCGLKSEA